MADYITRPLPSQPGGYGQDVRLSEILTLTTPDDPPAEKPAPPLSAGLRLLCVGSRAQDWAGLAVRMEVAGALARDLRWVRTAAEALGAMREQSFDCLLIRHGMASECDPFNLLPAIRSSGCDDPILVICSTADEDLWNTINECGAELFTHPAGLGSTALLPLIARTIRRVELIRENHRLAIADRRRLSREREEAERLLDQQRQIIQGLELLASPPAADDLPLDDSGEPSPQAEPLDPPAAPASPPPSPLSDEVSAFYHELLRTYVIMGSGSLGSEIARLADLLCAAGYTPRQALGLHLERVEHLIRGLGSRSARHVLSRADLLALELTLYLAESYQRRPSVSMAGFSLDEQPPAARAA